MTAQRWAVCGALLVPIAALDALLTPYRLGLLAFLAVYALASVAQNLLSGYADVPSLGNVVFFGAGAYVTASLNSSDHLSAGVAILAGVAGAALLGLVAGAPALRLSGMHLAIVTVALVFVAQDFMGQWDTSHGVGGITVNGPGWLLGERGLYLAAIGVSALGYAAVWNLLRSGTGRAIRALAGHQEAAEACGISSARVRLTTFVASATLTGCAGVLYLYYAHTVTPGSFTLDVSLAFLTMSIVGGSGSLVGSMLGALIIGMLPQATNLLPPQIGGTSVPQFVPLVYAVLVLVVLRSAPSGLWGVIRARTT